MPKATGTVPDGDQIEFSFDNELPINAWDVVLQVVYRGPLEAESDAVVVATKDISEPTNISVGNYTDYNFLNGGYHTGAEIEANDTLWNALNPSCRTSTNPRQDLCVNIPLTLSLTFGQAMTPIVVSMHRTTGHDGRVTARHFARIAVLGDAPPFNQAPSTVHITLGFDNPPFFLDSGSMFDLKTFEIQQKDPQRRVVGTFKSSRGVRFWDGIFFVIDGSTAAATGFADVNVLDSDPLLGDERFPLPVEITGWN